MYGRGKKLSKPKKQNITNPFILNKNLKIEKLDIWTFFETEEKKKEIREKKSIMKDYLKIE